jgi:hypothetical protein
VIENDKINELNGELKKYSEQLKKPRALLLRTLNAVLWKSSKERECTKINEIKWQINNLTLIKLDRFD